MSTYVLYNKTSGQIIQICHTDNISSLQHLLDNETDLIESAKEGISDSTDYVINNTIVSKGQPPVSYYTWDWSTKQWLDKRDLIQSRTDKLNALKKLRDTNINSGFIWDNSPFDSDATAQLRILGAVVAAAAPDFPGATWRLADNTWRNLSAQDILAVYQALQQHIRMQFNIFANLEAQVLAATTVAEVDAIQWPAT